MTDENQTQEVSTDLLNATVGDNEGYVPLECKPVGIEEVVIQTHNKEDKKMDNELVQIHCKHPDKEELIKITQIKKISGDKMVNTARRKCRVIQQLKSGFEAISISQGFGYRFWQSEPRNQLLVLFTGQSISQERQV